MKTLLATSLVWLSTSVQAHPGHDHGSWTSDPIHLSLGLATLAVVGLGAFIFNRRQKSQLKNKES